MQAGFTISIVQNALWKATSMGVCATCYKSLKLLVQGKNCENFVEKYCKNNQTLITQKQDENGNLINVR